MIIIHTNQMADEQLQADLAQVLTQEIRNLIRAKEALDAMSEQRRGLQAQQKEAKERILNLMTRSNIDKANFEQYAVSVATSNRKQSITCKNLGEILKLHLPDQDAEELCAKITGALETVSSPFVRLSKSKR